MHDRLPILLFGMTSMGAVILLLLFLYRYATGNVEIVQNSLRSFENGSQVEHQKKYPSLHWLDKLAKERKPQYSFPVLEIEIKLPLGAAVKKKNYYRLLVKDLDPYKSFCLKEILKKEKISYAMFRKKTEGVLVVKDLNEPQLHKVIGLIQEYDVDIKTENYTKD